MNNTLILQRKVGENPDRIFIVDDKDEQILTSFRMADIDKVEIEKVDSPVDTKRAYYNEGNSVWCVIKTSSVYDFKILVTKDGPYGDDYEKFATNLNELKNQRPKEGGIIKTPYLIIIAKSACPVG